MAQDRLGRPVRLPASSKRGAASAEEPSLDRGIQDHIGSKLRAMYDELRDQPVPDRFVELLRHLERDSSQGKKT